MKKALYLAAFLAGAAVGALGTVIYVRKNYDVSEKTEEDNEIAEDDTKETVAEIEESKEEALIRRTNNDILKSIKDPEERAKKEKLLNEYFNAASVYGNPKNEEDVLHVDPYKIRPDEFSQFEDYSAVELTLYSDGIVADDRDEIVENVDELLGPDFKDLFDDGEDEVFIRNDLRCCDYAVTKDLQTFEAYDESRPHFNVED